MMPCPVNFSHGIQAVQVTSCRRLFEFMDRTLRLQVPVSFHFLFLHSFSYSHRFMSYLSSSWFLTYDSRCLLLSFRSLFLIMTWLRNNDTWNQTSQALSPPQDIDSRLILLLSTLASRDPSFIALSLFLPLVGHLLRTIPLNCSAYSYRFTFSLLPLKCKKVDFGDLRPIETEGNIKDVGLLLYGRAICQSNTSN